MGLFFVLALLALLAGVGIVALIETEPGYLLIAYGGYTIETSFWVGIVAIGAIVLLGYALLRFLHRLVTSPSSLRGWAGNRRLRQSARLTNRGMISFVEGNWSQARKQLERGARHSEAPLVNNLLAARASHRLQDAKATQKYLGRAGETGLDADIAVDLTRAELQIQARQYDDALKTLERARADSGKHPGVLYLLFRAYDGLGDIEAMAELLPKLRRYNVAGSAELDELEARVYRDLLEKAAATSDLDRLKAVWKDYPSRLRDTDLVQLHYLEALFACDEAEAAEKIILRRLKKRWHPPLVDLYGRSRRDSAEKQLTVAEEWLKDHPEDPTLLLCLGRLAMIERLWSRARDYLERSHALDPTEETCLELGRLLAAVGEHAAAATLFRSGIRMRSSPLPDLPQPDDVVPEGRRLGEE